MGVVFLIVIIVIAVGSLHPASALYHRHMQ